MFAPQPTQISCPQCQHPFVIPLQTIVDVGQQPELKEQLLRGQLNLMSCPSCKTTGMLATPLLYHDPAHELLLALVPMQLGLKMEDQERTIGRLTNALMDKIPPEQRKGYLLQPKTVFSLETLVQDILQADGITPEMIEAQNHKLRLIEDLAELLEDEERLEEMVKEHQEEIKYEFFLFLTQYADMMQQSGDHEKAAKLIRLREKLTVMTGVPAPKPESVPPPRVETREELIDLLLDTPGYETRKAVIAVHHPLVDYLFFQTITNRIDSAQAAGDTEQSEQFTKLRTELLEITDELDREAREEMGKATALLQEILQSPDREQAIRERVDRLDETFLIILAANISTAQDQKQEEIVKEFQAIYTTVLSILEEKLPPELGLVNRLVRAETTEARRQELQAHLELITPRFLELLDALAKDAEEQKQTDIVRRLRAIVQEAKEIGGL